MALSGRLQELTMDLLFDFMGRTNFYHGIDFNWTNSKYFFSKTTRNWWMSIIVSILTVLAFSQISAMGWYGQHVGKADLLLKTCVVIMLIWSMVFFSAFWLSDMFEPRKSGTKRNWMPFGVIFFLEFSIIVALFALAVLLKLDERQLEVIGTAEVYSSLLFWLLPVVAWAYRKLNLKKLRAVMKVVLQTWSIGFHALYNPYKFAYCDAYGKVLSHRLSGISKSDISKIRKELIRKLEYVNKFNNVGFAVMFFLAAWTLLFGTPIWSMVKMFYRWMEWFANYLSIGGAIYAFVEVFGFIVALLLFVFSVTLVLRLIILTAIVQLDVHELRLP